MPRGKSERQTPGAGVSTWDFALGRGSGCIWSAAISTTPTARWKKYHFVRLFSREGSALLELLRELQDTGKAGGAFFAEVLAKTSRLAEAYPGYLRRSAGAEQTRLTDRCLQVLRMQSMGLSLGEIAQQLNLSERSVKYQSEQAYRKLGVNNKIEAIETARRMHLL